MNKPVIGITLDWLESGSFSKRPHYAIRQGYFDAVEACGGLPIALPLSPHNHGDYLQMVQGVIIPGGDYPSPGWWYGKDDAVPPHPRADADVALIKELLTRNIPLLGICAGMQALAVATGGRLHWNIAKELKVTGHRETPPERTAHGLAFAPNTRLRHLATHAEVQVNSHHNEGVATVGDGVVVSARAPDGVIEAIEVVAHPFALGVQWHPEFLLDNGLDRALFAGLMAAARK